jgi:hypothetical protein
LRDPGSGKGKYPNAFWKNDQVKKVFWALFIAMAGLVMAQVVDLVTTQQIGEIFGRRMVCGSVPLFLKRDKF